MARPIRIEYAGALYHVMARGSHGQEVYEDDTDRKRFLATLGEACQKTGWWVHAFVLMANHYHLLLETPEANLVAGMKWLQGTYTQRYNHRHRLFGHLFQGRYKAIPVDGRVEPDYLQVVSTYIHLNPARAGLLEVGQERLSRYKWSSYRWYVNPGASRPEWLHTERVMGSLGLGPKDSKGYEAYMEGRVLELGMEARRKELEEQWKELRRGWYVGGERFLETLEGYLEGQGLGGQKESHSGGAKEAHDERAAQRLLRRGLEALGLRQEQLDEMAKSAAEKRVLAWWLRQRTTVSLRWLTERLKMGHYTRVSQAIGQVKRRPGRLEGRLKGRLEALETKPQGKAATARG